MNNYKVLFIQGISSEVIDTPPMGLAYMAACLEKEDCDLKILVPNAPYFPKNYAAEILNVINAFQPDLIGFSIYTTNVLQTYELITKVKSAGVPLIAGGPHPSLLPEEVLKHNIDIVVVGEGEITIVEVVKYLQGKKQINEIQGIYYKDSEGNFVANLPRPQIKDLDSLPLPAKHLYENEHYIKQPYDYYRFGYLLGTRGCPAECTYCSKNVFEYTRTRSPENIIKEIKSLKQKYNISHFSFLDDVFSIVKKNIYKFCQLLKEKELKITWDCITRIDHITEDLLLLLKDAGCTKVNYGMESINEATIKRIKKGFDQPRIVEVIEMTERAGLAMDVNFIWGFPWENIDDISNTLNFVKKYSDKFNKIMQSGVLIPFPGTELYEEGKEKYNFENWWLDEKKKYDYNPFFHQHYAFRDALIENSFYNYSKGIKKTLKEAARFIGRHNTKEKNIIKRFTWRLLIRTSIIFSSIWPEFEIKVFQKIFHISKNYYHKLSS